MLNLFGFPGLNCLSPFQGLIAATFDPGLAPWAAFLRRVAAGVDPAHGVDSTFKDIFKLLIERYTLKVPRGRSLTGDKKGRSTVMERPVGEVLRGGGKTLSHRRRSRIASGARLLRSGAGGVRHQADIHAAVGGTAFSALVFLDGLVLAQAD